MSPEDLQNRVLYRDANVLVLNKPHGLPVHAGGKSDHHLMHYLDALRFGLPQRPELAHRLDKDTSGCLVLGRHRRALARLGEMFATGQAEKTYWAVVVGQPPDAEGVIDKPLKKLERRHGWRMVVAGDGQPSQTAWRVLAQGERLCWIMARPLTGRTHQIRVHLASMGWPLVGDSTYGRGTGDLVSSVLHLHARQISLPYGGKNPLIQVSAPVPDHMRQTAVSQGWGDMSA